MLFNFDCRDAMSLWLAENSVDAIVTDPPYGIEFMGKGWDRGVPGVEYWQQCLKVLKPGGYLLAFSGTRTYHRMACAIEDAGFEVRDQIGWAYGSGFPKSHNGPWGGTALKPAWEPICMARKPLIGTVEANWLTYGTGALNIDGCRVEFHGDADKEAAKPGGKATSHGAGSLDAPGSAQAVERAEFSAVQGAGRWPANLIHDGSDEVLAGFPQAPGQMAAIKGTEPSERVEFAKRNETDKSAARFFYCAKSSKADRGEGNTHPTVKPTDLMRYLCRLVTPPGGVVLDPFMGSGSTGCAAVREGFRFIGCELSPEYFQIADARITAALVEDIL